jgi:hypothetical protein
MDRILPSQRFMGAGPNSIMKGRVAAKRKAAKIEFVVGQTVHPIAAGKLLTQMQYSTHWRCCSARIRLTGSRCWLPVKRFHAQELRQQCGRSSQQSPLATGQS